MKITKHKVNFRRKESPHILYSRTYGTREEALQSVERNSGISSYFLAELDGEVEIELYCYGCDRDLKIGDEYISIDAYTRFCSDCYKENRFTYYTVCGEEVGDENNVEVFDEDYKEVAE